MNLDGLEAIIELLEMGAMSSNRDIAKCLRSAVAVLKEQEQKRKPLTDEQIEAIAKNYALGNPTTPLHFARAIEAKLWEKNGC